MKHPKTRWFVVFGFLLFLAAMSACSTEPEIVETIVEKEVPVEVTVEVPGPEVEVTRIVEVIVEAQGPKVPYEDQWMSSGHADASAEAFVHWNEDDPQEVPTSCAKCHSTPGYLDYIGADGSEVNVVNMPAPIGTTVTCEVCHNDVTPDKSTVLFPSGVEVTGLGPEARCMECHQGRASTIGVNEQIAEAGLTAADEDVVSEEVGFSNIHYYAAAATQFGTVTMGGYEYGGKSYDGKFDHVEGYDTCVDCHNPHTLEVQYDECTACHEGVEDAEDLLDIRMQGSLVDYDGDGDMEEGVYYEIEGLREQLAVAMGAYTGEVTGKAIAYNVGSYPYFFVDTNGDGMADDEEANRDNRYDAWTPRLARAAYNYQVSLKDPGRYAHGGKYIIQLLYDSIESMNEGLAAPAVDMTNMRRIDHGHFAGSEEAFRHWDEDGFVPGSCSKCHSAAGLPFFLTEGANVTQPTANGLNCATCHNDLQEFTIYEVANVTFPSGATVSFGDNDPESNLCINCHQGRESTVSVNQRIGDAADDVVSENLRFVNIHYFAAGATVFGTEVKGAYEYDGQEYLGKNEHVGAFDSCTECHNTHQLEVEVEECADCHEGVETKEDLKAIRVVDDDRPAVDYDGDGDVEEGIAGEIETLRTTLYQAMQAYSAETGGSAILYSSASYPYFFNDLNGNGEADPDEISRDNQFSTFTPRLLRASYNYQYATKDPGAFAHNGQYVIQVLYDSINDVGGDVSGMTRP